MPLCLGWSRSRSSADNEKQVLNRPEIVKNAPLPPWTTWKLEVEADLTTIEDWNQAHPEDDKLVYILKKTNAIIDSELCKAALDFIPENPLPARALVKSLISLVRLVIQIPQVKREVYEFTVEVINDMDCLTVAFGDDMSALDSGTKTLLLAVWKDLQKTRDIVHEICKWANEKLGKTQFGLSSTSEEIREFTGKLDHARNMFLQRTVIQILRRLLEHGKKIDELLEHKQISRRLAFIKATFEGRLTDKARYQKQTKQPCHEETREDILGQIDEWVRMPSDTPHCWWITGRAAIGKSAIGVTTAKCLRDRRTVTAKRSQLIHSGAGKVALVAQYFVNYQIKDTTDPDRLFPTMAWQLANASPVAALIIYNALTHMPSIADALSAEQAKILFVHPLCAIAQHEPSMAVAIIDGVDELANTNADILARFTRIISTIVSELPRNAKILVFSRPEQAILDNIAPHIRRIRLKTEESKSDVERFIHSELTAFGGARHWKNWPTQQQVDVLCRVADGHLGSAKVAFQWIARRLNEDGELVRDTVFDEVGHAEMIGIDDLYAFILDRVVPKSAPYRRAEGSKAIIGCLVALKTPQNVRTISSLLLLKDFDILHFIRLISSIVVDGTEPVDENTIPRPHKSFIDYITSSRPHPRFRIDLAEHHRRLVSIVLDPARLHFNIAGIRTSYEQNSEASQWHIDEGVVYACDSFMYHLLNAGPTETVVQDVKRFMQDQFLFWLEVVSLKAMVNDLTPLQHAVKGKDEELVRFIIDAQTFVDQFERTFTERVPHIYISALPLAPASSVFANHYRPRYPHTLSVKEHTQSVKEISNLGELSEAVIESAAMCNNLVLVNLGHRMVRAFDSFTGDAVFSTMIASECASFPPLHEFGDDSLPCAFSPDGNIIALGMTDCELWNVRTGEGIMRLVSPKPTSDIASITFSHDSAHIAIGYWTGDIYVWDFMLDGKKARRLRGHTRRACCLAYSTDGTRIVSGSFDKTVRLWDVTSGSCIYTFSGHIDHVCSITFSPDGSKIASGSGSDDNAVRLWDVQTRECRKLELHRHQSADISLAFSPDGRYLVSGTTNSIQIFDVLRRRMLVELVADFVHHVAFSVDGKRILSTERRGDGTIVRVWEIESLLNGKKGSMDDWTREEAGWIVNADGQPLFQAPEGPFRHIRNTVIIATTFFEIDASHFVHGDEWEKCREPLTEEEQQVKE